jgi:hypothetical protein
VTPGPPDRDWPAGRCILNSWVWRPSLTRNLSRRRTVPAVTAAIRHVVAVSIGDAPPGGKNNLNLCLIFFFCVRFHEVAIPVFLFLVRFLGLYNVVLGTLQSEVSPPCTSHIAQISEKTAMCCTSHDAEKIAISLAAGPSAGPGLKKSHFLELRLQSGAHGVRKKR